MLQVLHQMFNVSALLLYDALKPATPLTNGAISGVAGLSASSTNKMDTLKATSTFGLGRRRQSSPPWCHLHHLRTVSITHFTDGINSKCATLKLSKLLTWQHRRGPFSTTSEYRGQCCT